MMSTVVCRMVVSSSTRWAVFCGTYLMNNFSHVAHFSATFSVIWLQQVRSAAASGSFSY